MLGNIGFLWSNAQGSVRSLYTSVGNVIGTIRQAAFTAFLGNFFLI